MSWYNPLDWFKQETPVHGGLQRTLFCDNPQCKHPIDDNLVAYDHLVREVYHPGECPMLATSHRVMKTGKAVMASVKYISLDDARQLLDEDRLVQSCLEKKVFDAQ